MQEKQSPFIHQVLLTPGPGHMRFLEENKTDWVRPEKEIFGSKILRDPSKMKL